MKALWLIGLGGGLGSVLRYLVSRVVQTRMGLVFPYGTLVVNVLGCFVIGIVLGFAARSRVGSEWHVFLATGLCGGFTTFSTFSLETVTLLRDGHTQQALYYVAVSLIAGLLATVAGLAASKLL
jgi:CrcB protein